ncbi:EF-P 5-aminopentanol modification-associated protein YfmH [Liquorilactobacillus hordei]|uniref:Peptidase n=1 Tax=Liquorilactobacillus hordei DSM 19519 TaxID=1423759 RepID=A0A0R1MVY1_9LACO|nr:pitrilysin family protein [Liquorilactobacillus hordei]KRL07784.1 peptidase [Liquorilactobacillus hordei DSM 19519]QYH52041.1 insulinase family protein [Liquorilactobacillus hordei DSM 19519]
MKIIDYPNFEEKVYQKILTNGLTVNLVPKVGFHKIYASFTVDYGSVDSAFMTLNDRKVKNNPEGVAHFLEHKLFEKANYDAFELFGQLGADSNAFTSYTKTSYLFSTVENGKKCIETLLDFVQSPYFTTESVEKEKGIIAQEIKMYNDDYNWRLYSGIVENLYPNSPLSKDIAGTVESIQRISAKDLYDCYHAFYQPSNMVLFVVGAIDPVETINWIEENQKQKEFPVVSQIIHSKSMINDKYDIIPYRMLEVTTSRAKVAVGIRGNVELPAGKTGLKYKIALNLGMYLLMGESSEKYNELYDEGLIDDSFDYDISVGRGYHFCVISGETSHAEELTKRIIDLLKTANNLINSQTAEFLLAKKEFIGRQIQSMNSLEGIANRYEGNLFAGAMSFDAVEILEKIELKDVLKAMNEFIEPDNVSVYQVLPKEDVN